MNLYDSLNHFILNLLRIEPNFKLQKSYTTYFTKSNMMGGGVFLRVGLLFLLDGMGLLIILTHYFMHIDTLKITDVFNLFHTSSSTECL